MITAFGELRLHYSPENRVDFKEKAIQVHCFITSEGDFEKVSRPVRQHLLYCLLLRLWLERISHIHSQQMKQLTMPFRLRPTCCGVWCVVFLACRGGLFQTWWLTDSVWRTNATVMLTYLSHVPCLHGVDNAWHTHTDINSPSRAVILMA